MVNAIAWVLDDMDEAIQRWTGEHSANRVALQKHWERVKALILETELDKGLTSSGVRIGSPVNVYSSWTQTGDPEYSGTFLGWGLDLDEHGTAYTCAMVLCSSGRMRTSDVNRCQFPEQNMELE